MGGDAVPNSEHKVQKCASSERSAGLRRMLRREKCARTTPGVRRFLRPEDRAPPTGVAERGGFEPPVVLPTHAFQACALNHSATSPTNRRVERGRVNGAGPLRSDTFHRSAYFARIRVRGKLIRQSLKPEVQVMARPRPAVWR